MGKSNKKVKSDRINSLRKQYDAFLEEDKKRKDRNVYILEKIDKMRSCTALVQVRHDHNQKAAFSNLNQQNHDRKEFFQRLKPFYDNTRFPLDQVNISSSSVPSSLYEETILKEISKKYILIPKQTNILECKYSLPIKSSVDDESDWKNKYNILKELKKNEKEEIPINKELKGNDTDLSNSVDSGDIKTKEVYIDSFVKNPKFSLSKLNNKDFENNELLYKFNDDFKIENDASPLNEQDKEDNSCAKNVFKTSPTLNENFEFNEVLRLKSEIKDFNLKPTNNLTEKEKIQTENEIKFKPNDEVKILNLEENDNSTSIGCAASLSETVAPQQNSSSSINNEIKEKPIEVNLTPTEVIESPTSSNNNSEYLPTGEDLQVVSNVNEEIYSTRQEYNIDPYESKESPGYDFVNSIDPLLQYEQQANFSQNPSEYLPHKEEDLQEVSNLSEEVYSASENINDPHKSKVSTEFEFVNTIDPIPHYEEQANSEKNDENVVDVTQIQDFEAERKDMLYTEQSDGNYAYDQTDTGDISNVGYQNNAIYEQNDQYAYYHGATQEQTFSSEVNEHEESTEQYDPHYEEQYGKFEQQYPQNESVEQHESEEYVIQQDYDQYEQTNYNVENVIEQQLDNEQGFIETPNVMEENTERSDLEQVTTENQNAEQEATNIT